MMKANKAHFIPRVFFCLFFFAYPDSPLLLGFSPIVCPGLGCNLSWSSRLCCEGTGLDAAWSSDKRSRPGCSPEPSRAGGLGRWTNSQSRLRTASLLSWLTGDPPSSPSTPAHHEGAFSLQYSTTKLYTTGKITRQRDTFSNGWTRNTQVFWPIVEQQLIELKVWGF